MIIAMVLTHMVPHLQLIPHTEAWNHHLQTTVNRILTKTMVTKPTLVDIIIPQTKEEKILEEMLVVGKPIVGVHFLMTPDHSTWMKVVR